MEIGIIERAFQLAKESHDIEEVRSKLEREGYGNVHGHLASAALRKDLAKLYKPGTKKGPPRKD